jgi:hypothetical protein
MTILLFLLAAGGLTGMLPLVLVIASLILFGIATFWWSAPTPSWSRLVSGGLFCLALALLLNMAGGI